MADTTHATENRTMPTLEEDDALLRQAVQDAGDLALTYFRQQILVNKKPDGSEVSEADLAVDAALKLDLTTTRPGYGWLSEECEDDRKRLMSRRVWVIDPIDGTSSFLRHVPEWTVSAALVDDGAPVAAVVYNPAKKEFFHAVRGGGAYLNGERIHVSAKDTLDGAYIIASGGLFKKRIWKEPWPEVKSAWVNSVAYRIALVACGRADATISLSGKSEWDIAAAQLILEEAGGIITDHHDRPLAYNKEEPRFTSIIAAPPGLHAAVVERTSRIDL